MQQNTGTQLLVKIMQERKKADGAVERGRGLADEMAGREDERPTPGRTPGTVSYRAPFLASPLCWRRTELALLARCIPGTPALQKVAARTMQLALELRALVDAGLMWRFPDSSPQAR